MESEDVERRNPASGQDAQTRQHSETDNLCIYRSFERQGYAVSIIIGNETFLRRAVGEPDHRIKGPSGWLFIEGLMRVHGNLIANPVCLQTHVWRFH